MLPAAAGKSSNGSRDTVPDGTPARLREDLGLRCIHSGIEWLENNRRFLTSLDGTQKNAAALVGYVTQWVDVGFDHPSLVKELLSRFPPDCRLALPLYDYLHLRMAEGLVAMSEEEYEGAIRHFETVLSFEPEISDKEL